jgi:hypothetical protein
MHAHRRQLLVALTVEKIDIFPAFILDRLPRLPNVQLEPLDSLKLFSLFL